MLQYSIVLWFFFPISWLEFVGGISRSPTPPPTLCELTFARARGKFLVVVVQRCFQPKIDVERSRRGSIDNTEPQLTTLTWFDKLSASKSRNRHRYATRSSISEVNLMRRLDWGRHSSDEPELRSIWCQRPKPDRSNQFDNKKLFSDDSKSQRSICCSFFSSIYFIFFNPRALYWDRFVLFNPGVLYC